MSLRGYLGAEEKRMKMIKDKLGQDMFTQILPLLWFTVLP